MQAGGRLCFEPMILWLSYDLVTHHPRAANIPEPDIRVRKPAGQPSTTGRDSSAGTGEISLFPARAEAPSWPTAENILYDRTRSFRPTVRHWSNAASPHATCRRCRIPGFRCSISRPSAIGWPTVRRSATPRFFRLRDSRRAPTASHADVQLFDVHPSPLPLLPGAPQDPVSFHS